MSNLFLQELQGRFIKIDLKDVATEEALKFMTIVTLFDAAYNQVRPNFKKKSRKTTLKAPSNKGGPPGPRHSPPEVLTSGIHAKSENATSRDASYQFNEDLKSN